MSAPILPAFVQDKFVQLSPTNQVKFLKLTEAQQIKLCSLDVVKTINVVRKEMTIGHKIILAFMDSLGNYYLNATQLGNLIDKGASEFENYFCQTTNPQASRAVGSNVEDWLIDEKRSAFRMGFSESSGSRDMFWGEVLDESDSTGTIQKYRLVKVSSVANFIVHQHNKGNRKASDLAVALMAESLEIRCESLFVGVSPNVIDTHKRTNDWLSSRQDCRSVHASFNNFCQLMKYPANHVHDRLTTHIFGQTKRQALASNNLIGFDPTIGLDYQEDIDGLQQVARMKVKLQGYRKGTWMERVDRAYLDSIK